MLFQRPTESRSSFIFANNTSFLVKDNSYDNEVYDTMHLSPSIGASPPGVFLIGVPLEQNQNQDTLHLISTV